MAIAIGTVADSMADICKVGTVRVIYNIHYEEM